MLPHGTAIGCLNGSVPWILWELELLPWLKWNFLTSGVAITKEASVWSEVERAGAEVSSFPSSDLSFLQKQKEEDFASVPSCLEESMLINCLTKDLETLSSSHAQVTLATQSCKRQFNKACHYCEDLQGEERKKFIHGRDVSPFICIIIKLRYFRMRQRWGGCLFWGLFWFLSLQAQAILWACSCNSRKKQVQWKVTCQVT